MHLEKITLSLDGKVLSREKLKEVKGDGHLEATTLLLTGKEPEEILKELERRIK